MDYKNTLNLPRTDFPMKADLVTREPQRLEKWHTARLYEQIQAARAGKEKFVLHDGPPFANGDVHIGTAMNKILKDFIVKYHSLRGRHAPYVPGWDCHGLPIEFKVSQEMRKAGDTTADAASIRKACDAYARKYIDLQRAQFKRLGVLGDWDHPYLTLDKEYEADELRLFADIVEKGFVYRGKKPVYWSIPARTALAEAEVEYHDHISQSIYVKFLLPDFHRQYEDKRGMPFTGAPADADFFLIIWTTTPWTLPANLAVAYNSNFDYAMLKGNNSDGKTEYYFVVLELATTVAQKLGLEPHGHISYVGWTFLDFAYKHPFIERHGIVLSGDFVEQSSGTGFVHIAPGHGLDDYLLGSVNGLPIYSPVNDDGALAHTNDLPVEQQMPTEMLGKSILEKHGKSDANEAVLHELRVRKALLKQENYHHSYPHCWRSKTPVIFRAMDQWFIRIDFHLMQSVVAAARYVDWGKGPDNSEARREVDMPFRESTLRSIDRVNWIPGWGRNRIEGAVRMRPDWCISRQRTWGVPIPAFYDKDGNDILNAQIVRATADFIGKHGSNIWFEKSAAELWSVLRPKDWNGPEAVTKSNDTLDVWIDSGSSSRSVLMKRPELQNPKAPLPALAVEELKAMMSPSELQNSRGLPWQADLYLEGSDQHRGWFQSSLLLSLAGNGAPPYKTVLTHGFMVDEDREKISKSKQTGYEKPQTSEAYVKKWGADVVRLWVASQDFRNDVPVSEKRLEKVGETYRIIRNALRYQLSNLYDFDPVGHAVPDQNLTGLDRWILGEFAKLEAEVQPAYDAYEFHVVYQKVSQFAAVELSAIYHDVVKDRLYTDAANSPRRRSTQTAIHQLVTGLCQMLSPILAFTTDEAWEFIPKIALPSVHLATWKPAPLARSEAERGAWEGLFKLRGFVLPELEKERQAKTIGKSLDAKITLSGTNPLLIDGQTHREALRELLNVSQLEVHAEPGNGEPTLNIAVSKALGQKCERCWHWEEDVGGVPEHATICGRCVEAVQQA